MQRISDKINDLVEELIKIENHLNNLNKEVNVNGLTEIEKLNDLIHKTTHETASEISFNRIKIMNFAKFIDLRNQFKNFSIEHFAEIIDSEQLSSKLKIELFKGKSEEEKHLLLESINSLRKTWLHEFENKSFKKIKDKYLT